MDNKITVHCTHSMQHNTFFYCITDEFDTQFYSVFSAIHYSVFSTIYLFSKHYISMQLFICRLMLLIVTNVLDYVWVSMVY